MNCLAIDTSSDYLSLAISFDERLVVLHEPAGQAHAERALPGIERLLGELGISLNMLDAVVFGQGPGSFTGLRIACGLAQGLAFSAGLPVITIPTLDCVAAQVQGKVLVCLDARMKQVYTATYDTENWQRLSEISLCNPEQVATPDPSQQWIGVGSGFAEYSAALTERLTGQLQQVKPELRPDARVLLQLAASGRYPSLHPRDATVLYIRDKVALTSIEQQAARK